MKIGLAKEIKKEEYRVGLTPASAGEYVAHGHQVMVESGAGTGSGFSNKAYEETGCVIIGDRKRLFDEADMIIKVKEPLPEEYGLFHPGQILLTFRGSFLLAQSHEFFGFPLNFQRFAIQLQRFFEKLHDALLNFFFYLLDHLLTDFFKLVKNAVYDRLEQFP